ncbi:MAG: class I SAM-dependent methyltransferase [Bacillota bacterium]
MQEKQTEANRQAWNTKAYDAWLTHFGTPDERAKKLREDPKHPLRRWLKYIGEPRGKRIMNLLGSTGGKAIPLAILGADVTIVDFSEDNRRYALEVSKAADVQVEYILADVLNIPNDKEIRNFDIVLMEFGILHYFTDLHLIFAIVANMLKTNGRFVLTDFHPFASKVLNDSDNKITLKPEADYFHSSLIEDNIAYTQFLPEDDRNNLPKVLLRKWTLGEILTTLADEGMYLRTLEEEPHPQHKNFPAFYTIVADKIAADPPLTP